MSVFLDNGRKIFDVARSQAGGEDQDFALLFRDDGGLHMIMESPLSLEAAAIHAGAVSGYRVTRSSGALTVSGQTFGQSLRLEDRTAQKPRVSALLRDQPLYRINSPLLGPGSAV